ncbi:MAG: DNA polymerase III subunit delta', partial [Acidobacteria bacterium]|nr:DNA polymerase III subunit delta' [Acidobacteriota bacterium]
LAERLNCLAPADGDACGACEACRRIARGVHPDVIVVLPGESGSIKIEQVREVIDRAAYRPFEGRRRAVVVNEADAMVPQAQNALLKTLEEPPPASVFILVSSMPDALLPTVRSRCSNLRFGPLSPAEVARVLTRDHQYADDEARAAAAEADGSVGAALAARTIDLTAARGLARELLERAAGAHGPARLQAARAITAKKGTSAVEREHLVVLLRVLASLLRDIGILAARADTRMLANPDLEAELGRLAGAFDSTRSTRAFSAVDRALAALERNASPKIVADWLVLQL